MKVRTCVAIALCLSAASSAVKADSKSCLAQAETAIQQTYCEILRRDPTIRLPNMGEFKNNPEGIQRLLIRRPAERFGLELPAAKVANSTALRDNAPPPKPAPQKSRRTERQDRSTQNQNFSFANCVMSDNSIECGQDLYRLQVNLRNNQLRAEVFSKENQLNFPTKERTEFAQDSDYRYLSHLYPTYIYKMLELGLGDSTMSFTKFATVYWQAKLNGENFHERFRQMYNQLKIEKSQNGIKARYRDNYPIELHQCMRLDADIIVCDDMAQNWVYRRA
jgi:hypothetical protein